MISFKVYKDGKRHVLTMSYDDGQIFDKRLVEIFDKYGIRGTFHLNSGNVGCPGHVSEEDVRTIYKNHEVSCHTVNHPWLEKCDDMTVIKQIMEDRRRLESLCGYPVRGMSYPFGTHDERVRRLAYDCGIRYSRTCDNDKYFGLPKDFMQWAGTCHHRECIEKGKEFLAKADGGNNQWFSGLLYVWGHSFEFDRNNNWELIEQFCEMMSGHDFIWYATNIEIYDYVMAQRALQISVNEDIIVNPTSTDVWIEKDGKIVKIPAASTVKF